MHQQLKFLQTLSTLLTNRILMPLNEESFHKILNIGIVFEEGRAPFFGQKLKRAQVQMSTCILVLPQN